MLFNLSDHSAEAIRKLRFSIGLTLTIALAFGFNWPLAFITPVFVAKFLGSGKAKMPFKTLMRIFSIIVIAFVFAIVLSRLFLPYPMVFILITTLTVFWIAYWNHSGGNEFVILMLLVGITVIPMLALLHQTVAAQFTLGFLFSCLLSIFIAMIMHELIPDKACENVVIETTKTKEELNLDLPSKTLRVQLAVLTTLIIMPAMIFFLYFDLGSAVMILAFIAILAQKPDAIIGVKGSKALLVGNSLGGIIAIVMYNILVVAPSFGFMLVLFSLVLLIFSSLIFSSSPLAPLFAMALSTVIILIAASTLGDASAGEKFYTRIIQISAACIYIVLTTLAASPWLSRVKELENTDANR
jgi:hypothetical protein